MAKEPEELEVDEVLEETEAFVTYDIASYPSDLTLSVLAEMWKNGDILIPEFQRNFVWTIDQSSLLIESFLLGLPVPQVFFYVDQENKNLVIDGQQRILSVVFFLEGYFGSETLQGKRQVFRLTGLDDRSPFAKKRLADLDEPSQRKLRNAVLRAINIRQLDPKGEHTSVYHIFERLNTGGTPLKPQEIRNCVFRGDFAPLLKDLNKDKNWRLILGKKSLDKHQKDVELVLRLFALSRSWNQYEKPMKEFLNVAMQKNRQGTSPHVKWFSERFPKATAIVVEALGEKPFHIRGPLNSSVLDSVMCMIIENLERLPKDVGARYKRLVSDNEYLSGTFSGTSDVDVLKSRFQRAREFLSQK